MAVKAVPDIKRPVAVPPKQTGLVRQKQLANALGVSERLIRKWQANKVISFRKVGRTVLFNFEKVKTELGAYEINSVSAKVSKNKVIHG